LLSYFLV